MGENNPNSIKTLREFAETNTNLLTVFGIFNALTIYSASISNTYFSMGLSFLFMGMAIIVWIEIYNSFPSEQETTSLILFKYFISLTALLLILYWIYDHIYIWRKIIVLPLFILVSSTIVYFVKTKFHEKIQPPNDHASKWTKIKTKIIFVSLIALILIVAWTISVLLIEPGLLILDCIEKIVKE